MERDLQIKERKTKDEERKFRIAVRATNDEELKFQIAVRCAKAAFLLLSLNSTPNHTTVDKERKRLLKVIADLKLELVRERYKNKQIKICSFALQIMFVLLFASFLRLFLGRGDLFFI